MQDFFHAVNYNGVRFPPPVCGASADCVTSERACFDRSFTFSRKLEKWDVPPRFLDVIIIDKVRQFQGIAHSSITQVKKGILHQ